MGTLVNDCDQCWFDHVAQEVNQLAGTTARIYLFEEEESTVDPVWGEEETTVYKEDTDGNVGIACPVFFKAPDRSGIAGEEGYRLDRTSTLEIARKDMDDRNIRRLRPGDIILLWGDKFYDVVESHSTEGQISDSGTASMYKFDVVRRTKGVPESIWRPGEDNG